MGAHGRRGDGGSILSEYTAVHINFEYFTLLVFCFFYNFFPIKNCHRQNYWSKNSDRGILTTALMMGSALFLLHTNTLTVSAPAF